MEAPRLVRTIYAVRTGALRVQAHALEGMTEAIMITLADRTIQTVNRAFCEITGYERDDAVDQSKERSATPWPT